MKTHKNIDRLFQEKLKDFEVSPPKGAWNNIEKGIHGYRRKPLIPLWFKITSAAAILILLSIAGVNYFNTPPSINEIDTIVTDAEKITIPTTINPSVDNPENNTQVNSPDETLIVDAKSQESEKVKKRIPFISKELNPNKSDKKKVSNDNNQISSTTSESLLDKKVELTDFQQSSTTNSNKTDNGSILKSTKNSIQIADNTNGNSLKNISKKLNTNKSSENNQISSSTSESILDKKVGLVGIQKNNEDSGSTLKSKTASSATILKKENNKESKTLEETFKEETGEKEEDIIEVAENTKGNSIDDIEDLLKNEEDEEDEEDDFKKWSVATQFGPVFYNSFTAENSLIDESFIPNESQINNSISAGVKVGYKLTKKLSLQSGVNIINVTSQTNNVFIQTSLNPQYLGAIQYDPLAQFMNISSTPPSSDVILARSEVPTINSYTFEGVLNQEFGYIEVPLEVKYNLTNGKVGLNLVGGFSTLFLSKNSLQYETEGFSAKIGEANNLNDVNFSGNLGIDIDYKLNKQLYFNLSPMVKIQTNTFSSNSGNFKPYVIGVYTGLNYSF